MTGCAHCGRPITVTSRNPDRRYCSPRCRVADWHTRHDRPHPDPAIPHAVPHDEAVDDVPDTRQTANGVPAANGDQHCPHCHAPLAVISVLIPAAAAIVPTPEPPHA